MGRKRASRKAEEEEEYTIKGIHAYKQEKGKDFYFIEWEGYPMSQATWEPRQSFINPTPEIQRKMANLKNEYKKRTATASQGSGSSFHSSNRRSGASKDSGNSSDASEVEEIPSTRTSGGLSGKRRRSSVIDSPDQTSTSPEGSDRRETDAALRRKRTDKESRRGTDSSVVESSKEEDEKLAVKQHPPQRPTKQARHIGVSPVSTTANVTQAAASDKQAKISSNPDFHETAPDEGVVRVRSLKQHPVHKFCTVLTLRTGQPILVPIQDTRQRYPQLLIDFLLDRVQFRRPRPATG